MKASVGGVNGVSALSSNLTEAIGRICDDVASSRSAFTRRTFLEATEKLAFFLKAKVEYRKAALISHQIQSSGEEQRVQAIFNILNENLSKLVAAPETNATNLMYMFDIIFNLLAVPVGMYVQKEFVDAVSNTICCFK
jgi:hypothetical protein